MDQGQAAVETGLDSWGVPSVPRAKRLRRTARAGRNTVYGGSWAHDELNLADEMKMKQAMRQRTECRHASDSMPRKQTTPGIGTGTKW